ncbi:MAG: 2-C-methyl-D-erythritol 4-phosphate cytidylyltransferase [Dehalococcoidia bacterium]
MDKDSKLGVVIVAGGLSQRMAGINKLFVPLKGRPLLAWSVDACQKHRLVRQVVLVLNDKDLARGWKLQEQRGWSKATLCPGGARRQDSVTEGLRRIRDCDWVMIHDGARPFLTPDLIEDGLKVVEEIGAAAAAAPVKDTIKLATDDRLVGETLQRDRLWVAQTPQIFGSELIKKAYENLTAEVTDDAAAVECLGHKVQLYMGDYRNIKVTTSEDLALARIIAKSM